ncbi:unnamed protein product [Lactuca saligna]|uniref:Uncharacterized protein n=1 Tax=Lactuca saligna TaxID=75948 RepID=A0AA35YKT0_LACSI|nr:unnamed protein product [Lactuca saligna]
MVYINTPKCAMSATSPPCRKAESERIWMLRVNIKRDTICSKRPRFTEYVYGVVVYTGPDTKVVRNSMTSPSKRSRVVTRLDKVIYVLFLMLIIISLITSIDSSRYTTETAKGHWYLQLLEGRDESFDPCRPLIPSLTFKLLEDKRCGIYELIKKEFCIGC